MTLLFLGTLARIVVGTVLLIAGIAKLRTPTWGTFAIENGIPRKVVIVLPAFEATLGLALVVQLWPRFISIIATMLFLIFTIVVIGVVRDPDREMPCNCFGVRPNMSPMNGWTVARNVLLSLLAVVGAIWV